MSAAPGSNGGSESRLPSWAPAVRRGLFWVIGALYLISIPWYRGDADPGRWLGLPSWVTVAVACYVAVAFLNSAAWLLTDIPDDVPAAEPETEPGPPDGSR